ncbi:glutamine amidotransferase-related protein [Buchnera aphidicola]
MQITQQSLFDDTIQDIKITNTNFFGFQRHPEASPGPQDEKIFFINL